MMTHNLPEGSSLTGTCCLKTIGVYRKVLTTSLLKTRDSLRLDRIMHKSKRHTSGRMNDEGRYLLTLFESVTDSGRSESEQ